MRKLRLSDIPPKDLTGDYMYRPDDISDVLKFIEEYRNKAKQKRGKRGVDK